METLGTLWALGAVPAAAVSSKSSARFGDQDRDLDRGDLGDPGDPGDPFGLTGLPGLPCPGLAVPAAVSSKSSAPW